MSGKRWKRLSSSGAMWSTTTRWKTRMRNHRVQIGCETYLAKTSLAKSFACLFAAPPNLSDSVLVNLKGLTQLQTLDLNGTKVTDAGLMHFIGLPRLDYLSLANTAVSDAGLAQLNGLTRLRILNLIGTQVTDAGLARLNGLTKLQMLELHATKVTDAGVEDLQKALPNCKIIR